MPTDDYARGLYVTDDEQSTVSDDKPIDIYIPPNGTRRIGNWIDERVTDQSDETSVEAVDDPVQHVPETANRENPVDGNPLIPTEYERVCGDLNCIIHGDGTTYCRQRM